MGRERFFSVTLKMHEKKEKTVKFLRDDHEDLFLLFAFELDEKLILSPIFQKTKLATRLTTE